MDRADSRTNKTVPALGFFFFFLVQNLKQNPNIPKKGNLVYFNLIYLLAVNIRQLNAL